MDIIAVRHGETEGNVRHIVESRSPGVLSTAGTVQARQAAQALRYERIEAIYSSDLRRCTDTAQIIAAYHPGTGLMPREDLRERNQGMYEGGRWEAVPYTRFEGANLHVRIPGGESWCDVEQRMRALVCELAAAHQAGAVLLVTHGGPIKALRALLGGISLADSVDEPVQNAAIYRWPVPPALLGRRTVSD